MNQRRDPSPPADPKPGLAAAPGLDFEAAMTRLEQIVRDLESGDQSLDAAIKGYEEGMQLVRRCATELRRAEEQVKRLTEEAGRILAEDFAVPGPGAADAAHDG
jgi:exodeoxyribonuclease VII small subunit